MSTPGLSLDEYQRRMLAADYSCEYRRATTSLLPLLRVLREADECSPRWRRPKRKTPVYATFNQSLRGELADALEYVATLASQVGLSLEEVAHTSFERTASRGIAHEDGHSSPQVGADEDVDDRLAQRIIVRFDEHVSTDDGADAGPVTLDVALNGELAFRRVSNPDEDTNDIDDYWRYDLALKMGYLAVLGWSPMIRAAQASRHEQVRCERRGEVREQVPAVAIEEVLTAEVFAVAGEHSFFENGIRVPYHLLKSCIRTTGGEVTNRSLVDWEQAILAGHRAFAFLVEHRSGVLVADLRTRTLTPYTVEQFEDVRAA